MFRLMGGQHSVGSDQLVAVGSSRGSPAPCTLANILLDPTSSLLDPPGVNPWTHIEDAKNLASNKVFRSHRP